MSVFFAINRLADALVRPFTGLGPVAGLAVLGLVTAAVLLTVFKKLSNQEKIREHKGKIFGNFLEIAIYRDQFRRTLRCQAAALGHNLLYMRYFLTPVAVMMVPMLLVCLQVEYRLGSRPLTPGQSFIAAVRLEGTNPDRLDHVEIGGDGLVAETPPLRAAGEMSVYRRLRVEPGDKSPVLRITIDGREALIRPLAVAGGKTGRFTTERNKAQGIGDLLVGGEAPIPAASEIRSVRVPYPAADYPFFGWRLSPLVYYLLLTIGLGLVLKPLFKVTI